MELYLLTINVTGQKLTLAESADIYSGDKNIDSVQFVFTDSKWDSMTEKWAIFKRYGSDEYQVSLDNTNKAVIPAEVMQTKGYIYIGLLGTDGDEDVQTSSVLQYKLGEGVINENGITPPGDIYSQFIEDLNAYQTAVSELASIEARVTTAETTVQNLESRVTVAETTVSDMEDTVDGLVSDVSGMRTTVDGLQTDVTNLQTSVSALESAVPTLQSSVSELQTNVTNLEGRLTTVSTSVGSLETRLATVQTSLTDLEDGLTDAEGRLTTIGNQITDAQTDIEEIETAIQQDNIVTDVTGGGVSFVNNHVADLSFMTVTDTATGSIATFPDGSGLNAVSTEIQIEPKQSGSGTPSPDNVREISGFSAVTVTDQDDTTNPTQTLTTTINLGQTVYGGTLNVESGELVVDRVMIEPTSVRSVAYSGSYYYSIIQLMPTAPADNVAGLLSNRFKTESSALLGNCYVTNIGTFIVFVLEDQTITTKEGVDAWLSSNYTQFCYKLATPQTYQLTAQQIQTLNGTNNIWADSGDISLEYIANIKKYIEKVIS